MPRKNARKVYENLPFPVSKYHKSHQKSSWKSYGIIFDEIGHTFEWWYVQYVYATHCSCCKIKFKNSLNRKIEHNHSITDAFNVRGVVCAMCNSRTKDVKISRANTSGEKHIIFDKIRKKWVVRIRRKYCKFNKQYETLEEAVIERDKFINANPQMYSIK